MLISKRIYELMNERGISQIEFAKKTGISQSTISDWRRKGTNPSADKVLIICDVLNVSPYELLEDTENLKLKKYKRPEWIAINKDSEEYVLIEAYRNSDWEFKKRMMEYVTALEKIKDERQEITIHL